MIPCPFILIAFAAPASEVGGARHPSSLSLFVGLLTEPCFASLYCALSGLVSDVKLLDPKMVLSKKKISFFSWPFPLLLDFADGPRDPAPRDGGVFFCALAP